MPERLDDTTAILGAARHTRRRILGGLAGGTGGLFLLGAASTTGARHAFAFSDDDDDDNDDDGDNSGSGSDNSGSGSDHSGHGGGGDEDEAVAAAEVPAGSIEVQIVGDDADGFSPATLTVDQGQSVSFVNVHSDDHTATGSGFDTGIIGTGGVATVTLDTPGTFAYACQIHPEMTGSIAVRDASGNVPPPSQAAPVSADATTIQIAGFAFSPASVSVPAGTTVAWTNADSAPHTVTALDGSFDSGIFDPGGGFAWEFTSPGTFAYQCALHPQMQGEVVVTGDGPVASSNAAAQPAGATTTTSASSSQPAPSAAASDAGLVGAWLVVMTLDDASVPPPRALMTLHVDGTIDVDLAGAIDAVGAPGLTLGDGHGVWRDDGDGRYALTVVALLVDESQRFAGTATLRETGTLDSGGDTYSGSFSTDLTDPEGAAIASTSGATQGTRIAIEAASGTPATTPAVDATAMAPAAAATDAGSATVEIVDFAFSPANLEIAAGTTVTWTNQGAAPHTATGDGGSFDTGRLDSGQSGTATFDQPGAFPYVCSFHPDMTGTITVQ